MTVLLNYKVPCSHAAVARMVNWDMETFRILASSLCAACNTRIQGYYKLGHRVHSTPYRNIAPSSAVRYDVAKGHTAHLVHTAIRSGSLYSSTECTQSAHFSSVLS